MIKRTKVHHWLCRKMVLHGKQEYCTSQNKGILYITEIRNIVHHRKQEYCTSLKSGILYITEKKEFCTTQKTGILYNTEIRNIVHHWYTEECEWALCCSRLECRACCCWKLGVCPVSCFGWSLVGCRLMLLEGWTALAYLALVQISKEAIFLPQLCILHFVAPALYITYFMSDSDLIKICPKVRCYIATYLLSTTMSADGRCHWQCILKKNVWLGGLWG